MIYKSSHEQLGKGKLKSGYVRCSDVRLIQTCLLTSHEVLGLCCSTLIWGEFFFRSLLIGRPVNSSPHFLQAVYTMQVFTERHQAPIRRKSSGIKIRLHPRCTEEWCLFSRLLFLVWVGSRLQFSQKLLGFTSSVSAYDCQYLESYWILTTLLSTMGRAW